MKAMSRLAPLVAQIDAMSLRERALVFGAGALVLVALAKIALIDPELVRQRNTSRVTQQNRIEMRAVQTQIQTLVSERNADPNAALRARVAALKKQIALNDAEIDAEQRRFTPPERMRNILEEMVLGQRGLRLLELKTIPAAEVTAAAGPMPRKVYRHGVELTVEGSYRDLHAYLNALEDLPTQLYWGGAELVAGPYPESSLKLIVYTLSVDQAWMVV
jgi:MSHA biogenesis protein MshJ